MPRPFTAKDDRAIEEMRAKGMTWGAIAYKLNRDPDALQNRWWRLRTGRVQSGGTARAPVWTFPEDEAVRAEYAKEEPDIEGLAKRLDRTVRAVEGRAVDLGIKSRLLKRATAEGTAYRRCHDCGKPCLDYRCPACRRKWRDKHGISPDARNDEGLF